MRRGGHMAHGGSVSFFAGTLLLVSGVAACGAQIAENWKIKWRVWDRGEQACTIAGAIGAALGCLLFIFGCGPTRPEPTDQIDPVTVEVDGPAAEFEPTMNSYLRLSLARIGLAECEAAHVSLEEAREIRATARRDAQLLLDEFGAYVESGVGGAYCGPVCEKMKEFLENADVSICEE